MGQVHPYNIFLCSPLDYESIADRICMRIVQCDSWQLNDSIYAFRGKVCKHLAVIQLKCLNWIWPSTVFVQNFNRTISAICF